MRFAWTETFPAPFTLRIGRAGGLLTLLMAAVLVAGCTERKTNAGRAGSGEPVPILAEPALKKDVPVQISAIGNVQAFSVVSVRPQITGPILEVHFREGQEVKAGDPLFTIDPRPWEAALNLAQANLQRDQAQLINARLQFLRTSNLFESRVASQADYEAAEASYQALQSIVAADLATVTNAQLDLDYTRIRAPIDGRTGNLTVRQGNVVKATDDVLVTITRTRPILVAFAVPEIHLPAIRRQSAFGTLKVEASVSGDPEEPTVGELTFIDNSVDTNTGTILLKATFANEDQRLWPGQFVETTVTLSKLPNATVVPAHAVQIGQDGDFVFVVKDDSTVEARPVQRGLTHGGWVVIHSGVAPGDMVVTEGHLRLTPGAAVSVGKPDSPKSTAESP